MDGEVLKQYGQYVPSMFKKSAVPLYLHPPKPEPEAEYDFYGVIPLTHRKTKGIIKDKGYHVTGFVLTREDGDKCVVDMSAVRWLTGKEFFEMMHPPVVSPTAEPEAEPRVWMMTRDDIENAAFEFSKEQVETYWKNRGYTIKPLYTRPEPARKPMTEEEAIELCPFTREEFKAGFLTGVRFAEKHHGIDGNPSEIINNQRFDKFDPDSIDLQSRCRGDKE